MWLYSNNNCNNINNTLSRTTYVMLIKLKLHLTKTEGQSAASSIMHLVLLFQNWSEEEGCQNKQNKLGLIVSKISWLRGRRICNAEWGSGWKRKSSQDHWEVSSTALPRNTVLGVKKRKKKNPPPQHTHTHTSRLQATKLNAANEILKEDISLIKTHKGHP